MGYNIVRRKTALCSGKPSCQYGPIVRIALDELSFIDPSAWKDIMSAYKGQPTMQKDRI
jgi:hypothetical protein